MQEILVDIYKTNNLYSGLGQFSINFAKQLVQTPLDDVKINFLVPKQSDISIGKTIQLIKADWQKRYFPAINKDYALWHSLYQFPSHLPNKRTKQILTIHDLNFLSEKSQSKSASYLKRLQKNVDRADCITTISYYTKKIIEENLNLNGKDIRVIHNGIYTEAPVDSRIPTFVPSKNFFFAVGIFNQKKNFHVLLPLMKYFKDFYLIIAGDYDTPYGQEVKAQIAKLNLENRIILAGKIREADKYWLYNNCKAFMCPSLAEGFGMPVIEAMKFGKPVFLSKYASLPEIGGDRAYYFDDFDENYMHTFIEERLNTFYSDYKNNRKATINYAKKFNWKNCMEEYLNVYKKILNH